MVKSWPGDKAEDGTRKGRGAGQSLWHPGKVEWCWAGTALLGLGRQSGRGQITKGLVGPTEESKDMAMILRAMRMGTGAGRVEDGLTTFPGKLVSLSQGEGEGDLVEGAQENDKENEGVFLFLLFVILTRGHV